MSVWVLAFTLFDQLYVVRGNVYAKGETSALALGAMDYIAAAAPMLFVVGLILRRCASVPVASMNDPRIDNTLHHVNHV